MNIQQKENVKLMFLCKYFESIIEDQINLNKHSMFLEKETFVFPLNVPCKMGYRYFNL